MQLRPNRSLLVGRVSRLGAPPAGREDVVELTVERCEAADGFKDFIGAAPGDVVRMLSHDAAGIRHGSRYAVTASVIGGPGGERIVIQDAKPI